MIAIDRRWPLCLLGSLAFWSTFSPVPVGAQLSEEATNKGIRPTITICVA